MEFVTTDKENPVYSIPLTYQPDDSLEVNWDQNVRFRLILVEDGRGIIYFGTHRELVIAPTVICLNETEQFQISQGNHFKAQSLFFHPSVINSIFDFQNVRGNGENLSLSAQQDLIWLKPFIERNRSYYGNLPISLNVVKRIIFLFQAIGEELHLQNSNWPYRSRSYFLELLFLLERVYSSPKDVGKTVLPEKESEIDQVILYLSNNYQRHVTLEELTSIFHTNRTSLTKRFRQTTGLSIKAYHNKIRIEIAALLIRDTLLPISEIMEKVGFIDPSHFSRTFLRFTGYSPSEYRKLYCLIL